MNTSIRKEKRRFLSHICMGLARRWFCERHYALSFSSQAYTTSFDRVFSVKHTSHNFERMQ